MTYGLLALLLFTALSGACEPQEAELPFETIEQFYYGSGYEDKEPGLMIVASPADMDQIDKLITPEAVEQLRQMDYGTCFAVIAFVGRQPTSHEGIRIERLVRQGNTVSVFAQIGRRTGKDIVTSPYHLIKVQKPGWWGQTIEFRLLVEGTAVATQSHFIP